MSVVALSSPVEAAAFRHRNNFQNLLAATSAGAALIVRQDGGVGGYEDFPVVVDDMSIHTAESLGRLHYVGDWRIDVRWQDDGEREELWSHREPAAAG